MKNGGLASRWEEGCSWSRMDRHDAHQARLGRLQPTIGGHHAAVTLPVGLSAANQRSKHTQAPLLQLACLTSPPCRWKRTHGRRHRSRECLQRLHSATWPINRCLSTLRVISGHPAARQMSALGEIYIGSSTVCRLLAWVAYGIEV